jgi:SAM-dependent methyltransferase
MKTKKDTKDTLKDQLMEYGLEIGKTILISLVKWKLTPKKKEIESSSGKGVKKTVKPPKRYFRKFIMLALTKEFIVDRAIAKINMKPDSKDYSWILDYPLRKYLVDLNDYIYLLKKEDKILDLGSGSGYFAIEVGKHLNENGKVFCIDVNKEALKKLKDVALEEGINNIELHRAKIEALPFESNTFDSAFLNMTLGQIPDKVKALSEIHRVLKKGGTLYITELLIDKYYCLFSNVLSLSTSSGFKPESERGNFLNYTLILKKE